jgi:hypothetical protein
MAVERTDLDISTAVEENIVTFDVTMDDVLVVEVFQTLASLITVSMADIEIVRFSLPRSK